MLSLPPCPRLHWLLHRQHRAHWLYSLLSSPSASSHPTSLLNAPSPSPQSPRRLTICHHLIVARCQAVNSLPYTPYPLFLSVSFFLSFPLFPSLPSLQSNPLALASQKRNSVLVTSKLLLLLSSFKDTTSGQLDLLSLAFIH